MFIIKNGTFGSIRAHKQSSVPCYRDFQYLSYWGSEKLTFRIEMQKKIENVLPADPKRSIPNAKAVAVVHSTTVCHFSQKIEIVPLQP